MPGPESSPNLVFRNLASQRLMAHVNGIVGLTEKGKLAVELVRINHSLRQHENPDISFAISGEQMRFYSLRREELCRLLEIPEREQGKRIRNYRRQLEKSGFPFWRIPTS